MGVDSFPGYYGPSITNSTTIAPVPADAVPAPKDGTSYSCVMSITDQSVPPDYYGCQVVSKGRAGQGRAGQGRAGQGRAGQGSTGQFHRVCDLFKITVGGVAHCYFAVS